jgi:hypothetical protein
MVQVSGEKCTKEEKINLLHKLKEKGGPLAS